ncbi:MAG: hypothetical protein H6729_09360 [Deltaproteobacteria bacterium]|nr:hypothetical protein [Deltaproteobacteria bacterium]
MINSIGTLLNDYLGQRGIEGGWLGAAIDLRRNDPLGTLINLHDQFMEAALGHATDMYERLEYEEIAPYLGLPPPRTMLNTLAPWISPGYAAGSTTVDLASGAPEIGIFGKIFGDNRVATAHYERLLRNDPETRQLFELLIGGRIVDYGDDDDGIFRVMPFEDAAGYGGHGGSAGSPHDGDSVASYLDTVARAAAGLPAHGGGEQPFLGMMLAGMAAAQGLLPAGDGWRWGDNTGPMGGRGHGSSNPHARPGIINNTNEHYESEHLNKCAELLRDPSLTVEDKVTLFIMLIMEKMDQDILRQAEYINSLQQQQGDRARQLDGHHDEREGGAGPGGLVYGSMFSPPVNGAWPGAPGSAQAGGHAKAQGGQSNDEEAKNSTIEIETLKLKRIVDKRAQMFDMLRQVIDRYNQSAKGVIDTMGR